MSGGAQDQRPVVTGLGVVAPNGVGVKEFWAATLDGRSGIDWIRRFDASGYPVRIGGEVLDFVPKEHIPSRLLPQTDRMTQHALTAAGWALQDAGADPATLDEYEMGVVTASSAGGFEFGQRELQKLWGQGAEFVSAYQSFAWFYAVNTGQISIRHGMRGHSSVLVTEQAGGLDAVAHGRRLLRRGAVRFMVTGGFDASLCPWGLVAQIPHTHLSRRDDPERGYLPFDADACGYVAGEGGAILILEDRHAARRRGAGQEYGEVAGYAATFDPPPGSVRGPALARAIRGALDDAGMNPGEIDVVFADASGVPELDAVEAAAIAEVFGPRSVPVTAPKTMTGRLYSGGAALDAATALLAMRDGVIPATTGTTNVASGYDIDLVIGQARETPVRAALVVARGCGGFNSALVLRHTD
ncbi:ketosynthase chain-length factor [Gandjariella thermophila]|uniref:Actinorhodin polyketide putative beta-ketoacyl synthase 2 n=1 Tax=Gandjariella thermophila TaxID=1931992 RepID=A0A4D4J8A5_9PSEU|nr:ketosynthase chain-length factor [Gandjariella thermophila]GDY31754.1 actinorhodin polyketide putative beta-ketoacyl synthase 2 [Gandjariella thermophila]